MWLAVAILILILLTAILAFGLFRRAFYRPGAVDPEDEAALRGSRWFAYGPVLQPGSKWLREQTWQEESVAASDGAVLRARLHTGEASKPVLLLFHDYGSSPWLDFCLHARWAIRRGWTVLLVEERAHGESGGKWCTLGIREGEDCLLWIRRAEELAGEGCRLVLGGMGLGAMAILSALDKGLPESVKALVLDSAFFSPKRQIKYMVRERLRMRSFPILQLIALYGRLCWGRGPGSLDGAEALKKNEGIPVFFAQGREDSMTPYAPAEQACRDTPAPKALFTGEGAGHAACALTEGERYFTALEDFLRKNLGESFPPRERTRAARE